MAKVISSNPSVSIFWQKRFWIQILMWAFSGKSNKFKKQCEHFLAKNPDFDSFFRFCQNWIFGQKMNFWNSVHVPLLCSELLWATLFLLKVVGKMIWSMHDNNDGKKCTLLCRILCLHQSKRGKVFKSRVNAS